MLVQEYLKKWRIFKRVKPKNDMMYHDIYNCICQNTKKIRFIIHYVKPTAQLLFRIRFPKGGPTCRRQVVNPRHQTSQGQSVAKPETPLQNILAVNTTSQTTCGIPPHCAPPAENLAPVAFILFPQPLCSRNACVTRYLVSSQRIRVVIDV